MSKEITRRRFMFAASAVVFGMSSRLASADGEEVATASYPDEERFNPTNRSGVRPEEPEECVPSGTWEGICTYYSKDGCVGCRADQLMANGQPFREWAMTIAFMKLPLNTPVRVTNLDNGKSVIAKVTDRGGFERYGILADLSLGVSIQIGNKSQASRIRINTLDCE